MTSKKGLQRAILCALTMTCTSAFGQEPQEGKAKQSEQAQRPKQLSNKAQQALANLHALNTSREEQLRTIINERIADLEPESTRAQQLRAQVQQTEKQR